MQMGTANHPQTDGQTEVMNRIVEDYLRIYCNYRQDDWDQPLSSAEFAYSSSKLEATGLTPFMMDLGWTPKTPIDLLDNSSQYEVKSVEEHIALLREIFKDVQESYAAVRDQQRERLKSKFTQPNYQIDDLVMVTVSAFRDHYIRERPSNKLGSKRIGPFPIVELVGQNAVRLNLPATMRVHLVINVSHISPYYEQPDDIAVIRAEPPPLPTISPLGPEYEAEEILQHRRRGEGHQFLVQ